MQITSRECSPKLPSRRRHDGCGASRPSPSRLKKRGGARTCPHFSAPAPEAARGQAPSTRTRSPKCSVGPPSTVRVPEKRIPHPKRAIPPIRPQQPPAMGMSSRTKSTGTGSTSPPDTIPEKNQRSSFMPPSSGLPFDADPLQGVLGPDRMADQILDVSLLKERFLFVI